MTLSKRPPSRCRRARRGQAAVELMMSMLFFMAMIGMLLSVSVYLYINHTFLTGAKEGARAAAVEVNLANVATYNTGVANVRTWVRNFIRSSTGITMADSGITVTGPTGSTVGNRTVQVRLSYTFQNPVQIRTFLNRLGGGTATGLDTFTITNTATMRYEE